jgi:hypothetical protein
MDDTMKEIAKLANLLAVAYPQNAKQLKDAGNLLQQLRDAGMSEHIDDVMHSYCSWSKVCQTWGDKLVELRGLVVKALPDLWPSLEFVRLKQQWHREPDFAWKDAVVELGRIEAAAAGRSSQDVGGETGPFGDRGFRWKGKEGGQGDKGMVRRAFALVSLLWDRKDHTATYHDVGQPVFGEPGTMVNDNQVGSARRAGNKYFEANGLPLRVKTSGTERRIWLVVPLK